MLFLPILNVIVAALLLIGISIYDMIAVWKTKHMVALAKFQIEQVGIFTGFFIPIMSKEQALKLKKMRKKIPCWRFNIDVSVDSQRWR